MFWNIWLYTLHMVNIIAKKNGQQDYLSIFLSGFMTVTEKELFSSVPANEFNTYWVPCTWFVYRLQEATKKGKLLNQYSLENIMRVSNKIIVFLWYSCPAFFSPSWCLTSTNKKTIFLLWLKPNSTSEFPDIENGEKLPIFQSLHFE